VVVRRRTAGRCCWQQTGMSGERRASTWSTSEMRSGPWRSAKLIESGHFEWMASAMSPAPSRRCALTLAPRLTSSSANSRLLVKEANSGVSPCSLATETCAPASMSIVASTRSPALHASISAVSPRGPRLLQSKTRVSPGFRPGNARHSSSASSATDVALQAMQAFAANLRNSSSSGANSWPKTRRGDRGSRALRKAGRGQWALPGASPFSSAGTSSGEPPTMLMVRTESARRITSSLHPVTSTSITARHVA
jgi:hypothetical protein